MRTHNPLLFCSRQAAQQSSKPDLIVLPECFNSPYGVDYFDEYSEEIGTSVASTKSDTVKQLSALAKEHSVWLVGGEPHSFIHPPRAPGCS